MTRVLLLGTNLTAITRCACNNHVRSRWSCQTFIPGTEMRSGNISLVAAALVAPVSFVDLSSLFEAAGIAMMSKMSFIEIAKNFVYPSVQNAYYRQQSDLQRSIPDPICVSMDGAYDSPGYSAEYCAVTAIEDYSHQVLNFAIVHK